MIIIGKNMNISIVSELQNTEELKLFELTGKGLNEGNAENISEYLNNTFAFIGLEIRNELILKLAKFENALSNLATLIIENFEIVPDEAKNILLKLASEESSAKYVADVFQYKFYTIPLNFRNELLQYLPVNKETTSSIAHIINESFSKIPEDIRDKLISELILFTEAEFYKFKILKFNFAKIPENLRNELLVHLAKMPNVARKIAFLTRENIKHISPETLGKILYLLYDIESSRHEALRLIQHFFSKLDTGSKLQIMKKLLKENEIRILSSVIGNNFLSLPENIRIEYMEELAYEENAIWGIVSCLSKFFDNIPDELRNNLIVILSNNAKTKDFVEYLLREK